MSNISQQLGNRIRAFRTNLSISQEELAFKSGISPAHLGQIERGLKSPTITTIEKIANALNVTLPDLFSFGTTITPETTGELNKIKNYLNGLPEEELKDINKIIKSIINFKNK